MRRGDIRWFRFASPDKRRFSQIPVIPLSTRARGLDWEVPFSSGDGLPSACVLKPEWIRAVNRREIGPIIAELRAHRWPEVKAAILEALGLSGY